MPKPVISLAFANDKVDYARYLQNLPVELSEIRQALQTVQEQGFCEVIERANVSLSEIFEIFQKKEVAIFHYGGHARSWEILLENSKKDNQQSIDAKPLNDFLARQKSLKLVFLNACTTEAQAKDLQNKANFAVIATENKVNDELAKDFAVQFYKGLANLKNIKEAYADAQNFVLAQKPKQNYWNLYVSDQNCLNFVLKNSKNMEYAQTILQSFYAVWESGGGELLKNIATEGGKSFGVDLLKNLFNLTMKKFQGKDEEETFDSLKTSIKEKNEEKINNKSEKVLQILQKAFESDPDFRKEVENLINGLDDNTKQALEKQSAIIIQNSKNVVAGNTFGNITGGFRVGDDYGNEIMKNKSF